VADSSGKKGELETCRHEWSEPSSVDQYEFDFLPSRKKFARGYYTLETNLAVRAFSAGKTGPLLP
jgi:hypothetical protein